MWPLFCFVENALALCEVCQIWLSPIKIAFITFFLLSACSCSFVCIYISVNAPSNASLFLQCMTYFCSFNTINKTEDSNVKVIIILHVKIETRNSPAFYKRYIIQISVNDAAKVSEGEYFGALLNAALNYRSRLEEIQTVALAPPPWKSINTKGSSSAPQYCLL